MEEVKLRANGKITCRVCQSKHCPTGAYVPYINNKNHQRWICSCCIVRGSSPEVIELIFEGVFPALKVQRAALVSAVGSPATKSSTCVCL